MVSDTGCAHIGMRTGRITRSATGADRDGPSAAKARRERSSHHGGHGHGYYGASNRNLDQRGDRGAAHSDLYGSAGRDGHAPAAHAHVYAQTTHGDVHSRAADQHSHTRVRALV